MQAQCCQAYVAMQTLVNRNDSQHSTYNATNTIDTHITFVCAYKHRNVTILYSDLKVC